MHAIRLALPHEYSKYRTLLKSLDPESKYLRFGYKVTDEAIDKLCDQIEAQQSEHILFCVENDNKDFIAVGHIALEDETELAFAVLDPYQGQGIGNALMKQCLQWCKEHGKPKGHVICLTSNTAMKRLCSKHSMKMVIEYGEIIATFDANATDSWILTQS